MSLDVNISEPDEFNSVELYDCLAEVAKKCGFVDFKYHVDLISGKGDNYTANIFREVVEDTNNENHINVIVKTLINATRRELFRDIHVREVMVYNNVITKFREILSNLDERQRINFPECLYTNAERNKEVIILKDLKDSGFEIDDKVSKFVELTHVQAKLILAELAKFHGISFVYKRAEKENFNELKEKFQDLLFQENFLSKSKLRNYFFESYDMSLKLVANVEVKKKLEIVRNKLLDILRSHCRPRKHNVLCHGDLWLNNILFKKDGEGELCFLDYQAMRYCSPVIDIIYFIYLSTTSNFRSDYFEELLQDYYDSLYSFLKLFDMDANVVYPQKDFMEDVEENLPFGLLMGLVEMRIITTSPEYEAILKDSKKITGFESTEFPGEIDLFKYRVNDLVDEFVNNGVLDRILTTIKTLY